MKQLIRIFTPILLVLFLATGTRIAKADLNASQIATQINAMNGGKGLVTTYNTNSMAITQHTFTTTPGYTNPDTSAYGSQTAGSNYFKSFCVEPNVYVYNNETVSMMVNYANGKTVTSSGLALTLGAAKLYKDFATMALGNYDYGNTAGQLANNADQLTTAIHVLIGAVTIANWSQNVYLSQLLAVNSQQSYWTAVYDPGRLYSEIGDYSVFVLNVSDFTTGVDCQDHLFLVKTSGSSVPEPASVVLWGLGSLGVFGISFARKRKLKTICLPLA
ncbi:MAG: hypothetical protein FWC50_10125 [Planctomycetaceae bacterium]|nr:hypothetical protein [Planctomycetaceae bacterium]